jgi:hypothetical protein
VVGATGYKFSGIVALDQKHVFRAADKFGKLFAIAAFGP